eukprot:1571633-Rhodomonas_salina.1
MQLQPQRGPPAYQSQQRVCRNASKDPETRPALRTCERINRSCVDGDRPAAPPKPWPHTKTSFPNNKLHTSGSIARSEVRSELRSQIWRCAVPWRCAFGPVWGWDEGRCGVGG